VQAGDTFVRLGRHVEGHHAGSQHLCGSSLRLGRVALRRFQPLAGGDCPAPRGVPVFVSEFLKPCAEGVKPGADLPLTA